MNKQLMLDYLETFLVTHQEEWANFEMIDDTGVYHVQLKDILEFLQNAS